jgi:hypothetical protein
LMDVSVCYIGINLCKLFAKFYNIHNVYTKKCKTKEAATQE